MAVARAHADQKHVKECTNNIVLDIEDAGIAPSLLTILPVHEHLPICQGSYHMPSSPCPQQPHMCHSCCLLVKVTVTFLSGHTVHWTYGSVGIRGPCP